MSSYKSQINKMVWSYSRLTAFHHCKYEFYLQYIIANDDEYLSESNYYAEVGIYVHDILAQIFDKKLSVEDAPQYYVDNFDDNVLYKTRKSIMDNTFEKCANYFAECEFEWLKNYEILGVEKHINFKVDKYNFTGFIDLLLRDKKDGKIVIFDHKSGEYPFKKNGEVKVKLKDSFEDYSRQMYLYAHAVNSVYGEFPKEMTWNYFKDKGQLATIQFKKADYDKTLDWAVDTIHEIESEKNWTENQDFFYCHNLCNFRSSCEYN